MSWISDVVTALANASTDRIMLILLGAAYFLRIYLEQKDKGYFEAISKKLDINNSNQDKILEILNEKERKMEGK